MRCQREGLRFVIVAAPGDGPVRAPLTGGVMAAMTIETPLIRTKRTMKMGDGMWQQSNASGPAFEGAETAKGPLAVSRLSPLPPSSSSGAPRCLPWGPFHSFPSTFVAVVRVVEPQGSRLPHIRPQFIPSALLFHPVFSVAKMLGYSKSATVVFIHLFLLFLGPAHAAPTIPEKRTVNTALRVRQENLEQSTTVTTTDILQT